MQKKYVLEIHTQHIPSSLNRIDEIIFHAFQKTYPENKISKSQIKNWISQFGVQAFSKNKLSSVIRKASSPVFHHIDVLKMEVILNASPLLPQEWIIFEDAHLLVINKPSLLPSQASHDPNRPNLYQMALNYYSPLALIHRIDKDTSGVIIFSKSKTYNKILTDLFRNHEIQKTYQALVKSETALPPEWSMQNYFEYKKSHLGHIHTYEAQQGDWAHTDFKIIKSQHPYYWIEAYPKTGRTHQIRAHLAQFKAPILGDREYGGSLQWNTVCCLHAYKIEFFDLHSKTQKTFIAPIRAELNQIWELIMKQNETASSKK